MEYAIQLLLPILGGLWLGGWLNRTYGVPLIWSLVLAIIGMGLGLGILYKRSMFQRSQFNQSSENAEQVHPIHVRPKKPGTPHVSRNANRIKKEKDAEPTPIIGKGVEELHFLYKDNDKIHPDFLPKSEKPDDPEWDEPSLSPEHLPNGLDEDNPRSPRA